VNTTLFNHNRICNDERPLISNADFKQLLNDVKAGNTQAHDKILETNSLAPYQHQLIQHELILKALGL
jgi:hypothetical protein